MSKPAVCVVTLGGTIAMTPRGDGPGVVPALSGEALTAAVPGLAAIADVQVRNFRQLPSAHLRFGDVEALATLMNDLVAQGAHGIVVTQGTDAIEETAFALDCLLSLDAPVVVTGAMRNPASPGADGPANLLGALQCAASAEARGAGCLVVMNDEVHAAAFVRKAHTTHPGAFASAPTGPIGWLCEGRVRIGARPRRREPVPMRGDPRDARVALLTLALDDDDRLIRAALDAGFDGLVVEAMGGGHAPVQDTGALEEAARKVPVILASRTGAGELLAGTYGFPGGEIDLQQRGLLRSGFLDGLKSRVLLTLLLRHGRSAADIERGFRAFAGGTQSIGG